GSERHTDAIGDQTGDDVGAAARREADDEAEQALGVLRDGGGAGHERGGREHLREQAAACLHVTLLRLRSLSPPERSASAGSVPFLFYCGSSPASFTTCCATTRFFLISAANASGVLIAGTRPRG